MRELGTRNLVERDPELHSPGPKLDEARAPLLEAWQAQATARKDFETLLAEYPGVNAVHTLLSWTVRPLAKGKRKLSAWRRKGTLKDVPALLERIDDLKGSEPSDEVQGLWYRAYVELRSEQIIDEIKFEGRRVHLPADWGEMKVSEEGFSKSAGPFLRPF